MNCKHYIKEFDCCARTSEWVEGVLCTDYCFYCNDEHPNCRHFEEKADVVPVVRCKDCVHYKNEWCEILKAETPIADGFCCYGERRCSDG